MEISISELIVEYFQEFFNCLLTIQDLTLQG